VTASAHTSNPEQEHHFEGSEPLNSSDKEAFKTEQVRVYPNPATDVVTVSLTMPKTVKAEIDIADMSGRVLLHQDKEKANAGQPQYELHVDQLPAGIYNLRVKTEDRTFTQKLTIVH
jgi:hypothetical protein